MAQVKSLFSKLSPSLIVHKYVDDSFAKVIKNDWLNVRVLSRRFGKCAPYATEDEVKELQSDFADAGNFHYCQEHLYPSKYNHHFQTAFDFLGYAWDLSDKSDLLLAHRLFSISFPNIGQILTHIHFIQKLRSSDAYHNAPPLIQAVITSDLAICHLFNGEIETAKELYTQAADLDTPFNQHYKAYAGATGCISCDLKSLLSVKIAKTVSPRCKSYKPNFAPLYHLKNGGPIGLIALLEELLPEDKDILDKLKALKGTTISG